jgi:hypothetical protein
MKGAPVRQSFRSAFEILDGLPQPLLVAADDACLVQYDPGGIRDKNVGDLQAHLPRSGTLPKLGEEKRFRRHDSAISFQSL